MSGGSGSGWALMAVLSLVSFVLLRVVLGLPFWITAALVIGMSVVFSIMQASSAPRDTSPQTKPETTPEGTPVLEPGVVQRQEPFMLTAAELVDGRTTLWGFRAISGEFVGGGRFPTIALQPGEQVQVAVTAARAGSILRVSYGYLTLTDRRLIFCGERVLINFYALLPWATNLRELSLPYSDIREVSLRKHFNLGMQLATLRRAMAITARGGTQIMWPNVYDLEAFAARIRTLAAEDATKQP